MGNRSNQPQTSPDENVQRDTSKPPAKEVATDFSELRFPKQPFQLELGKEDIPTQPLPEKEPSSRLPEMIPTAVDIARETERYRILESHANDAGETLDKFSLSSSGDTVYSLDTYYELNAIGYLPELVGSTVATLKQQNAKLPGSAASIGRGGYLSFSETVDGTAEHYLASPRFVLKDSGPEALLARHADEKRLLEERVGAARDAISKASIESLDKLGARVKELTQERREILKRSDKDGELNIFEALYEYDVSLDDEKYNFSPEDKARMIEIRKENVLIERQLEQQQSLSKLEHELSKLNKYLTSGKAYSGTLADGTEVVAFTSRKPDTALEFYDNDGNLIAEEGTYIAQYKRGDYGYLRAYTARRYSGDSSVEEIATLADTSPTSILYREGEEIVKEENFNADGVLETRKHVRIEVTDIFQHGALEQSEIGSYAAFIENYSDSLDHPRREELLFQAAKGHPTNFIDNFQTFESHERIDALIETAFTALDRKQLATLQQTVAAVRAGTAAEHDPLATLSPKKVEEWSRLLEFRDRMLTDAVALTRLAEDMPDYRAAALWNDPDSRGYFEIKDKWIDWSSPKIAGQMNAGNPELSKKELKLLAARYLAQTDQAVDQKSVNQALLSISELRERHQEVEVFRGRSVVVSAHSQESTFRSKEEHYQFAKPALLDGIRHQQGDGESLVLHQAELRDAPPGEEGRAARIRMHQEAKASTLESIVTTPAPLTFVFEGHGGPDGLYLSDGELDEKNAPQETTSTVKISSAELANAFRQRAEKFPNEKSPVVVLQCCYNFNFIRKFASELGDTPAPLVVGAVEFNQLGFFSHVGEFGSSFLPDIVGANKENDDGSNINSIIERQFEEQTIEESGDDLNTNPGIHVPDKEGNLRQISSLGPLPSSLT